MRVQSHPQAATAGGPEEPPTGYPPARSPKSQWTSEVSCSSCSTPMQVRRPSGGGSKEVRRAGSSTR
eukprot:5828075-Amphidinium_carterae.1